MFRFCWAWLLIICCSATVSAEEKLKALIVDGQNNHGMWPKTTVMMKKYLEDTGLFTVDVARTAFTWNGGDLIEKYPLEGVHSKPADQPQTDPDFKPEFAKYNVVVSNFGFNAAPWPAETRSAFEKYVKGGGEIGRAHV